MQRRGRHRIQGYRTALDTDPAALAEAGDDSVT